MRGWVLRCKESVGSDAALKPYLGRDMLIIHMCDYVCNVRYYHSHSRHVATDWLSNHIPVHNTCTLPSSAPHVEKALDGSPR